MLTPGTPSAPPTFFSKYCDTIPDDPNAAAANFCSRSDGEFKIPGTAGVNNDPNLAIPIAIRNSNCSSSAIYLFSIFNNLRNSL